MYASTPASALSWYEREAIRSLGWIRATGCPTSAALLDVGAGTSTLVDELVAAGFLDVTLLDISRGALDQVHQRLGESSRRVTFIRHDVLTWQPTRLYDVWHDRAVFHFLIDPADRQRYVQVAGEAVRAGGDLVLATFADDGPTSCSGLPVCRYSAQDLTRVFSAIFAFSGSDREEHVTPSGVTQPFTWVRLTRK